MFSKTALGHLVDQTLRGNITSVAAHERPLLMVNLLLADAALFRDDTTNPRLIEWLKPFYGHRGETALREDPPTLSFLGNLHNALEEKMVVENDMASAYIQALCGHNIQSSSRPATAISKRANRAFYGKLPQLECIRSTTTFVAVLGLKGSGKSYLLKQLTDRGEKVHEVYEYLDIMRRRGVDLTTLPAPHQWEDEPLMVGLRDRDLHESTPSRFFIGSLVRLSEAYALSRLGQTVFIHIESPNEIRHNRVRNRGRMVEIGASEDWLIELDAHRGGEWPGYETNDLGTLLALAQFRVRNDGTRSADELVEDILRYVESLQYGGG